MSAGGTGGHAGAGGAPGSATGGVGGAAGSGSGGSAGHGGAGGGGGGNAESGGNGGGATGGAGGAAGTGTGGRVGSGGTAGAAGFAGVGGQAGVAASGGQAGSAATSGSAGGSGGSVCSLSGVPSYYQFFGDFDGDGTADCALLDFQGAQITFHKGLGGGAYQAAPVVSSVQACHPTNSFAAALDLDGDGKDDIVATQNDGSEYIPRLLLGHADGTFQCPSPFDGSDSVPSGYTPTGGGAIGDFTGDGHDDVFLVALSGRTSSNQVKWIVFTGAGVGSTRVLVKTTTPGFNVGSLGSGNAVSAQNLDADAYLDAVVNVDPIGMGDLVDTPQTISVYGNGDGTFHCDVGQTITPANPTLNPGVYFVCQSTGVYAAGSP